MFRLEDQILEELKKLIIKKNWSEKQKVMVLKLIKKYIKEVMKGGEIK
jgi:hypothetical protein